MSRTAKSLQNLQNVCTSKIVIYAIIVIGMFTLQTLMYIESKTAFTLNTH